MTQVRLEEVMFIQGDVLAFVSLLIGTCLSAWALTVTYGLLFPDRSEIAKAILSANPGKCVGRGAIIVATLGVLGAVLLAVPNPVVKLVGWIVLLVILSVAALGLAGAARMAGDRMQSMAPEMNHYAAFCRGAAFMITGCIVPFVGWFAFGPVLFLAAVGAGSKAAVQRASRTPSISQLETA